MAKKQPKKPQPKEAETAVPEQTAEKQQPVKGEYLLTGFVPAKK